MSASQDCSVRSLSHKLLQDNFSSVPPKIDSQLSLIHFSIICFFPHSLCGMTYAAHS